MLGKILHFAFLLLLPLIVSSKIEVEKDRLSKIQNEIKKIEENIQRVKERKEKAKAKIREIIKDKEKDKENLKRKEEDIKKISKRIDITEKRIKTLTEQIKSKKSALSFVVSKLWLLKTEEPLFFNPKGEDYLMLIEELCLSIEGREREKKHEIVEKDALGVILTKTEREKEIIASNIKRKEQEITLQNKVIQETKRDEEALQKRIAKLKQDQKRLERLIAKLEAERKKLPKEHSYKSVGTLIWPTKSRNIVRGFGRYTHPQAGTTLINKGIDIQAPFGSPVFAVADGEVAYADWFMGYGNLIMIDHNGSLYSLYANLSQMNVASQDKVKKGQVIGFVGNSKETESPILHFEIRLNGQAQDPLDWLEVKYR